MAEIMGFVKPIKVVRGPPVNGPDDPLFRESKKDFFRTRGEEGFLPCSASNGRLAVIVLAKPRPLKSLDEKSEVIKQQTPQGDDLNGYQGAAFTSLQQIPDILGYPPKNVVAEYLIEMLSQQKKGVPPIISYN